MEKRHSMDRATVKSKLKDIHEANRRSGIKTEINVLPNAGQQGEKAGSMDDKKLMIQSYSTMFSDEENMAEDSNAITTMRSNAGIKFPVLTDRLSADPGADSLDTVQGQDPSITPSVSETINRLFDQPGPPTQPEMSMTQPGTLPSLPNYLQHLVTGLNLPQNQSSSTIGLIGQNSAQPITCTTVPTSGTYTNIASQTSTTE